MLVNRFPELAIHESGQYAMASSSSSSAVDSSIESSHEASPTSTNDMTSPMPGLYEEPQCNEVFATFLGNIFASGTTPGANQRLVSEDESRSPEYNSPESQDGFPYFVTNVDLQPFMASTIAEPWNDYPMYTNVYPSASITAPSPVEPTEEVSLSRPSEPELQYYRKYIPSVLLTRQSNRSSFLVYLFFSVFLGQMPLVHSPTWTMENKPPILINAMQACGALYVKTPAATHFINATLASARDMLIGEFVSPVLHLLTLPY